jgi:hypothetical protein
MAAFLLVQPATGSTRLPNLLRRSLELCKRSLVSSGRGVALVDARALRHQENDLASAAERRPVGQRFERFENAAHGEPGRQRRGPLR